MKKPLPRLDFPPWMSFIRSFLRKHIQKVDRTKTPLHKEDLHLSGTVLKLSFDDDRRKENERKNSPHDDEILPHASAVF